MVQQYPFKNIIVQHTTYSNLPFIAGLNEQINEDIIKVNNSIEVSFNNAKYIIISKVDSNKYQSCCCFHSHLYQCQFKANLSNELYNENEKKILEIIILYHHIFSFKI